MHNYVHNKFSYLGFPFEKNDFTTPNAWSQSYDRESQRQLCKILQRHEQPCAL
jgi:hypothetical protein